jgi:SPP1 gp7 family putative phage head morphogenesis protein
MAKRRSSGLHAFSASETLIGGYARQLRSLAREIAKITSALSMGEMTDAGILTRAALIAADLDRYSEAIEPWAETVAFRAITEVNTRNIKAWRASSRVIGRQISSGFDNQLVDATIQAMIREKVALIKNIPHDSGERIYRIVRVGLSEGKRAETVAKELMTTEGFAENRANLIARTEISKATTEITKVRAVGYDSPGYIWRTSHDGAVRPSHAEMEGRFVEWDKPPTLDDMVGHAGEFPNCGAIPRW